MRDSELFDLYMSDTLEHLNLISNTVLLLENDVHNEEYINNIFRAAHTIKGAAATLKLDEITRVTHKLEDLFGAIRECKIIANKEIVDVVLNVIDTIELLHEKLEDESIEVDLSVIDVMESFLDSNASKISKPNSSEELPINILNDVINEDSYNALFTEEVKAALGYILEENFNVYYISINIDEDCIAKGARAYLLLQELNKFGEPISISPSLEEIEGPDFNSSHIETLFVSQSDANTISASLNEILEVEISTFKSVTKDDVLLLSSGLPKSEDKTPEKNTEDNQDKGNESASSVMANVSQKVQNTSRPKITKENSTYVKVYTKTLDELMNEQGELLLEYNRLTLINERIRKKEIDTNELTTLLSDISSNISKIIKNQQDIIMTTRMFPIKQVFQLFPKMIRDLSNTLNKKINLTMDGESTELDRTVIEKVSEPLKHIIRNAVDHGIESIEDRIAAGKDATGNVYISAKQDSNNVIITVSDDGKGLNKEMLKRKAVEKNLYTKEQVEKLTDEEIYNIILLPGFSTASQVTEVSGRGVGMDIVKSNISEIGGVMIINSEEGKGTTFTLKIPFTLAISKAILMNIRNDKFVVLANYIKEVILVPIKDIKKIQNKENIVLRDKIYPLIYLRDVFNYEREASKESETVILIEHNGRSVGLVVDECLGELDIVIKNLPTYFNGITNYITGITKLGDGSIPVICDIGAILEDF